MYSGSHKPNIKVTEGLHSFLDVLGEHLFHCQLLEATCIPWLRPFPTTIKLTKLHLSDGSFVITSPSHTIKKESLPLRTHMTD